MNIPKWEDRISPCHFKSDLFIDYIEQIKLCLKEKAPYSWIRIGDGEEHVLGQDYIYPSNNVRAHVSWWNNSNYCGTTLPNLELRDRMIKAYKGSEAVGLFIGENSATIKIFNKIGIQPRQIFYGYDNVHLPMNPNFVRMLCENKVLVVGGGNRENRDGEFFANKIKEKLDIDIDFVNGIKSYADIENCMNQIRKKEFDIALVCAGVNAKVICWELSREMNKVFMDFGHAFDNAFYDKDNVNYNEYFLLDKTMI